MYRFPQLVQLVPAMQLDEAEDLLEELEDALISADFGPSSSLKIVDEIREQVKSKPSCIQVSSQVHENDLIETHIIH